MRRHLWNRSTTGGLWMQLCRGWFTHDNPKWSSALSPKSMRSLDILWNRSTTLGLWMQKKQCRRHRRIVIQYQVCWTCNKWYKHTKEYSGVSIRNIGNTYRSLRHVTEIQISGWTAPGNQMNYCRQVAVPCDKEFSTCTDCIFSFAASHPILHLETNI